MRHAWLALSVGELESGASVGTKVIVIMAERFSLRRIVERECRIEERGLSTVVLLVAACMNDELRPTYATIKGQGIECGYAPALFGEESFTRFGVKSGKLFFHGPSASQPSNANSLHLLNPSLLYSDLTLGIV